MRQTSGHADQVSAACRAFLPVKQQVDAAVNDEDVFVLIRMRMRRNEGFDGKRRMPGEAVVAGLLGNVDLPHDVPCDAVQPHMGGRDVWRFRSVVGGIKHGVCLRVVRSTYPKWV